MNNNWIEYYNVTKKNDPRKTVIKAIENFSNQKEAVSKTAIDLGCGSGADTIALLKEGWSVLAMDSQPAAISTLLSTANQLCLDKNLTTSLCSFESLNSLPSVSLINASFSLPFLEPSSFNECWQMIIRALHQGGRFAGSFFGNQDQWNTRSTMTLLTREKLHDLFHSFNIEFFEEEEKDKPDALGCIKHWHTYQVVAKKIKY